MFSASKSGKVAGALAYDPQFNYVTALLHGDGTNGAQNNTFLDSSSNAYSITRNGTPTQGSFSPYGSLWSNYLNGTSGAGGGPYLSCPNSSTMQFGSGSFTIEAWCYFTVVQESTIIARYPFDNTNNEWNFQTSVGLTPFFSYSAAGLNTGITVVSGSALSINTWYHLAVVKNGTGVTLYINGTSVSTGTIAGSIYSGTTTTTIGCYAQSAYPGGYAVPNGYLSNVRVVKGSAVYTSNFTPTTQPLTAITNTSLLTCQSNRFVDNSTNNFTITLNGTPYVQRFNPFLPTSSQAYSTSVYGGSGYFNGTTDYLVCGNHSTYAFGTGDFTLNVWVYLTSAPTYMSIADTRTSGWALAIDAGRSVYLYSDITASFLVQSASGSVPLNAWTYITVKRVSGAMTLYINAVSVSTASVSLNFTNTTLSVGAYYTGNEPFFGYICDFQAIKGTGTTPTLPTAPLTNVTNTQLLLSFQNGAIYDNAMMNDLLTGGSAQISTSVKKYGTGSLSFNGSTDYLYINASQKTGILQFGTGAYTVEFWLYMNSISGNQGIVTSAGGSGTGPILAIRSGVLGSGIFGVTDTVVSSTTLSTGQWYHVAFVRVSTSTNQSFIYLNGTLNGTGTISTNFSTDYGCGIGYTPTSSEYLNGYLDDLRITKGYARYTSNFTPPTTALPNYGS